MNPAQDMQAGRTAQANTNLQAARAAEAAAATNVEAAKRQVADAAGADLATGQAAQLNLEEAAARLRMATEAVLRAEAPATEPAPPPTVPSQPAPPIVDPTEATGEVAPAYATVGEFVEQYLIRIWRRPASGSRWCSQWWAHEEALMRLEALWRAWEHLRLTGALGMAVWVRDYLDPAMRELLDPAGTFAGCDHRSQVGKHALQPVMLVAPYPELTPEQAAAILSMSTDQLAEVTRSGALAVRSGMLARNQVVRYAARLRL